MDDYVALNRANWECRVPHHLEGYGLEAFRDDASHLSDVVRFDRPRLGDISGLDVVHLQCHIGTDSLSLARLGARVTGVDFSPLALEAARRLSRDCGANVTFVEAEVYDTLDVVAEQSFDLVYTGIGALCWLPDIRRWARVVARLLRPGGRLFLREGHPVLWSLSDPRPDGLLVVQYPYFESEGVHFFEEQSYVAHEGRLASPESVCFNHGVGEIITALMGEGLHLTGFEEHRSIPWNALGPQMQEGDGGEFFLREGGERLALSYTLRATKGEPG